MCPSTEQLSGTYFGHLCKHIAADQDVVLVLRLWEARDAAGNAGRAAL